MTAYPEIVRAAAEQYRVFVEALEREADSPVRLLAGKVGRTIEAALSKRSAMSAADVEFGPRDLRPLTTAQRRRFFNPWALGIGADDASVIFLGSEHAYDVDRDEDLVNFCTESIGGVVLWLSGSNPDVLKRMTDGAVDVDAVRPMPLLRTYSQRRVAAPSSLARLLALRLLVGAACLIHESLRVAFAFDPRVTRLE
jgi:hypothetical protein